MRMDFPNRDLAIANGQLGLGDCRCDKSSISYASFVDDASSIVDDYFTIIIVAACKCI